jgi:hypothetical protein
MDVRWTLSFLGRPFNILTVIKSYHGAFIALRSACIIFRISLDVKNWIGFVTCSGSSNVLLISFSNSSLCDNSFGLNTFSKCAAKLFAFSLSFRAQIWSFFFLLVAFVVLVVLIFWSLSRGSNRCHQSLLSFRGMSEMFLL